MRCGECLHEFGKPASVNSSKVAQIPRGRSEGGGASVMRDLTARKTSSIRAIGVIDTGTPPVDAKPLEDAGEETNKSNGDEEIMMPDGSRRVRRRKKRPKKEQKKGLVLFLVGWIAVVAIVFTLFKSGKIGRKNEAVAPIPPSGDYITPTEFEIWNESRPAIESRFMSFLTSPTLRERAQFIDRSADLSAKFERFYILENFPKPESKLSVLGWNVLNFSGSAVAIETIWGDRSDDKGPRWGATHTFDKREGWKLDWEAFAPYSTEPWSRFQAELGSKEGVFRLLVRRRRTSDQNTKISLSFYRAPGVFESDGEYRNTESPGVDLPSESELGQEFLKLWADHVDGKAPYGSILGKALDPENHMRITVRLAWEKDDLDKSILVLKEIIGVGWYGETIQNLHKENLKAATEKAEEALSEAEQ